METVFNLYKIRYDILTECLNENSVTTYFQFVREVLNIQNFKVILHINLESILKKFYKPDNEFIYRDFTDKKDKVLISSSIMNIIAHYRHYFYSRYKINTEVYSYYSFEKNELFQNMLPDYREEFYESRLKKYAGNSSWILWNFDILDTIMKSVPYAYLIDTDKKDPVTGMYFVIKSCSLFIFT